MNTTDKIKYFRERVEYYFFDFFHMYELQLITNKQNDSNSKAAARWHNIEVGAGQIVIYYSEDWIKHKNTIKKEIDRVAFHEVCEAMLWELNELAKRRFIAEKDIPNAIHRVIRRLENTVFPNVMDKRNK